MDLKEKFPKLISKIDEDINELRYLVVVDENYADIDDEENDIFDPNDYNYLVYITELTQEAIGIDVLERVNKLIEQRDIFKNFIASEIDLYGVMSNLNEDGVAIKILELIEELL